MATASNFLFAFIFLAVLANSSFAGFTLVKVLNGTGEDSLDKFNAFRNPAGVFVADNRTYVSDPNSNSLLVLSGNTVVRKLTQQQAGVPFEPYGVYVVPSPTGTVGDETIYLANNQGALEVYQSGFKNHVGASYLTSPRAVTKLDNYTYILDYKGNEVTRVRADTYAYVDYFLNTGSMDNQLSQPTDIDVDPESREFYIADQGNGRVKIFTSNFTFVKSIGVGSLRNLVTPYGVAVENGIIFVSDISLDTVIAYDRSNNVLGEITDPLVDPMGVYAKDGLLYVADNGHGAIKVYSYSLAEPIALNNSAVAPTGQPKTDAGQIFQILLKVNQTLEEFGRLKSFALKYGISEDTAAYFYSASAYNELTKFDFESAKRDSDTAYSEALGSLNSINGKLKAYFLSQAVAYGSALTEYESFEQKFGTPLNLTDFRLGVAGLNGFAEAKQFDNARESLAFLKPEKARIDSAKGAIFLQRSGNLSEVLSNAYGQVDLLSLTLIEYNLSDIVIQPHLSELAAANQSLSQAEDSLRLGDLQAFESRLSNATARLDASNASVSNLTMTVDTTRQLINSSRKMIGEITSGLFNPDVSLEAVMVGNAENVLSGEPQRAFQLAFEAHGRISQKYADINNSSMSIVFAVVAAIGAMAGLAFVLDRVTGSHLFGAARRDRK
ncbi:hypothetical protein COT30_02165 [Candidatus Micrarchaeota archaeon CG08_land_8_20_14_0_20_49_17]|nr:MAG: hypothetical protein AUJ13_01345 [Candidatus Micrarchaeota archaeon CG1_02_49_24]PIU09877.1 MAG: hypothetical protein COT30_02165 [Candidatus Micrarchaeota archaeon CG08_land_8_20_14_0_20_49_17]PIZ99166.1 MAG: hypothetical protein COX84_01330 [Candidatus Micrarchaeota archaeon CG_4_10_14_0_2_um_filter_49_7]HII53325.1 hypothetical protein [Candidatus Micrarchaeota archaeon]